MTIEKYNLIFRNLRPFSSNDYRDNEGISSYSQDWVKQCFRVSCEIFTQPDIHVTRDDEGVGSQAKDREQPSMSLEKAKTNFQKTGCLIEVIHRAILMGQWSTKTLPQAGAVSQTVFPTYNFREKFKLRQKIPAHALRQIMFNSFVVYRLLKIKSQIQEPGLDFVKFRQDITSKTENLGTCNLLRDFCR